MTSLRTSLSALLTLLFGLGGAWVFVKIGLPAPWLSGAMLGIVLMLILRLKPLMPDPLRDFGMLCAGAVMGSAITPEMLQALGRYPGSLLLLLLTTIGIVVGGRFALMRLFGWSSNVALFAALPGAMSAVLATAAAAKVDMVRVTTVQAFRMFVLVALLPSVVTVAVSTHKIAEPAVISASGFALVMGFSLALALLFARLGLLAPFLIGAMAAAGLTHATGWISGAMPDFIANLAMFLIGVFAGSRFTGLSPKAMRALFMPAFVLFAVTTLVAIFGAVLTTFLVKTPIAESLVAFAPGGLEAMVVLGMAMGLDPLYVSSHHIARFVMIAAGLPLLAKHLLVDEETN